MKNLIFNEFEENKQIGINEVKHYISILFKNALANGKKEIILKSGDIHSNLGLEERMPIVCDAMWYFFAENDDEIIECPPKKKGSRLIIKYRIVED